MKQRTCPNILFTSKISILAFAGLFALSTACTVEAPGISDDEQTDVEDFEDVSEVDVNEVDVNEVDVSEEQCVGGCFNGATCVDNVCEGLPQIAVGAFHNCALLSNGQVKCWGRNHLGQLGRRTENDFDLNPSYVDGAKNAIAITTMLEQTCIISADSKLTCWGRFPTRSTDGTEQENGMPQEIEIPPVSGSNLISEVAVGNNLTCVRMEKNSTLQCWGDNDFHQLGRGTTPLTKEETLTPAPTFPLLIPARQIESSGAHVCAALNGGVLKCWGNNTVGQIGRPAKYAEPNPVEPDGPKIKDKVLVVRVGFNNTCIVTTANEVKCWGGNNYGHLANGTTMPSYDAKQPAVLGNAKDITIGGSFICALLTSGEVSCVGENDDGQFGIDSQTLPQSSFYKTNPLINDVVQLKAGNTHVCAVQSTGRILCWGNNTYEQLATSSTFPTEIPQSIDLEL